ncbi:telomere length regulation protein-domain-containing protein [Dichotomopilus funicola]|uniref:Telomere length regulation protein-domain-containing protein n=1 Tax=Dichotomopilus funicola TaxID=1934379 RepID=A0AAN6V7F2_9PEZI|nr:telomere length regulation protein-domain-containing protein [Dichotomopilus funicola]
MDELLRPAGVIRTHKKEAETDFFLREPTATASPSNPGTRSDTRQHKAPTTPEEALEILKDEPDYDSLIFVLTFLSQRKTPSIKSPTPLSAQLIQVLVSEIVPNYWAILIEDGHQSQKTKKSGLNPLLFCLSSITGVNAILVRLRALTQEAKGSNQPTQLKRPDVSLNLGILLDLLGRVLQPDNWLLEAYRVAVAGGEAPAKVRPRVQEIVSTVGGGRIVSLAAEAEDVLKNDSAGRNTDGVWLADSKQFTQWLGRNIVSLLRSDTGTDEKKFASDVFGKALRLGHYDVIITQLVSELVFTPAADPQVLGSLIGNLPQTEQRKVFFSVVTLLSTEYLDRFGRCESKESEQLISAAAGALKGILDSLEHGKRFLVEWLTGSSGAGIGEGVGIRRSVMAVISQGRDDLVTGLEKSLGQFGDQLYIRHSPMLQQEAHAQVLLLAAGYVHRQHPVKLAILLRTGVWLNAISNRLAAPHDRARFLGMVVGESLSGLVDKGEKRLNFKMEETNEEEGSWYKSLTGVSDVPGPLNPLFKAPTAVPQKTQKPPQKATAKPIPQPRQTGFIIEELSDGEAPEEDDIIPYAKPDSDPEDSDDDATLVRRDKPKAPVYIRDLIRYFRDTESYDHQKLALTTAPTLIRRKANYGTEVSEHADELASLLVGLSDKFEIDNFDDLRLQGMMAIVVAQPEKMGQWFAKTFFDGDYSVSQRASVLVVLGLSARELAGYETSGYAAAAAFPSKTLPERVEQLYIDDPSRHQTPALKPLPPNALDNIASSLTSTFLAPMAAAAADAATGPDVLKLSTFTSRLGNDNNTNPDDNSIQPTNPKIKYKTNPANRKPRVRAIPNTTAQLLSTSFFTPLTARFHAALYAASSNNRLRTILFQPHLLALYLKTLALLLHAAGPSTLALPHMTAELWRLLLNTSVRAHAVGDLSVTRAILFALVALLDVNEARMRDVCGELGREVVETQEWVAGVFGGLRGGDEGGEEEQVKALAAGVLVRLREGVEKYRLLMVGDLIGF